MQTISFSVLFPRASRSRSYCTSMLLSLSLSLSLSLHVPDQASAPVIIGLLKGFSSFNKPWLIGAPSDVTNCPKKWDILTSKNLISPWTQPQTVCLCKRKAQLEHMVHVACTFFGTFGADVYAQSALSDKIPALELSRKFIKSALLVGKQEWPCTPARHV